MSSELDTYGLPPAEDMLDPVTPFDLQRMWLGDQPPLFLLEIAFRTTVIYVYSMLLIRWIGGRSVAQMSVVEFLLVIALGSAVGDAMFYPEVPLLHAGLVITIIVVINKALDSLIFHFRPVERVIEGRASQILQDGVLDLEVLRRLKVGQNELHGALRMQGVENLGEVREAFIEKSGHLTLFRADTPRPGLPIVPPHSVASPRRYRPDDVVPQDMVVVCKSCGAALHPNLRAVPRECEHCHRSEWIEARTCALSEGDTPG